MTQSPVDPTELGVDSNGWELLDRREFFKITDIEATIRHELSGDEVGLAALPSVSLRRTTGEPSIFELDATRLGAGGMGEVRLARQPALQRNVAIKLVRGGDATSDTSRVLLREALVMGYLEHPNIVPVHVVGRDEGGELVVAMKRIEGVTLQERVKSGYRMGHLDENLQVLIDVCNATEFAHRHGVVHLDIKPSNVMIGPYGEVYLLDWGTAVAYSDEAPPTIPRPLNDGRVRGTPAYMAPEMLVAMPPIPATDVHLLGGLLYAILTGHGPNVGRDAKEVLDCAYRSEPRGLPLAVPAELAAIVHRALARAPADRFTSAAELRDAVVRYRASAAARDMLEAAGRSAERFRQSISDSASVAEIYGSFGATRQLLLDAGRLGGDPGPTNARLQDLLCQMCDWELDRDNAAGAEVLLRDLPHPDPELTARVAAALKAVASEKVELRELRRHVDPDVANKQKIVMWLVIGVAIALIYITPPLLGVADDPATATKGHIAYLVVLALVTGGFRSRLLETRANRAIVGLVWLLSLFGLVVRLASVGEALSLGTAMAFDLTLVGLATLYGAITLDRRALAASPWYLVGAAICFAYPAMGSLIFGTSHGLAMASLAAAQALTGREEA